MSDLASGSAAMGHSEGDFGCIPAVHGSNADSPTTLPRKRGSCKDGLSCKDCSSNRVYDPHDSFITPAHCLISAPHSLLLMMFFLQFLIRGAFIRARLWPYLLYTELLL